jgi:hypothetical protein
MSAEKYSASAPHHSNDSQDASLIYPNLRRPNFSEKDPDRNNYVEESDDDDGGDDVDYGAGKDELFDTPR